MKPTIIAIVGASGSGKTYLSKLLQNELNVFLIVSFTTRPRRKGEIEGVDHYYIKRKHNIPKDKMLSYTQFANNGYFALEEQVPPSGFCAYVVDEYGLTFLKKSKSDKFNIVSIRVESENEILIKRGIEEERIQRDECRELLPLDYYDHIITNDGTLEEFDDKIRETFKTIQQWQHQK